MRKLYVVRVYIPVLNINIYHTAIHIYWYYWKLARHPCHWTFSPLFSLIVRLFMTN